MTAGASVRRRGRCHLAFLAVAVLVAGYAAAGAPAEPEGSVDAVDRESVEQGEVREIVAGVARVLAAADLRALRSPEAAQRGRVLLEVGCASGDLVEAFRELGYDAYGVEDGNGAAVLPRDDHVHYRVVDWLGADAAYEGVGDADSGVVLPVATEDAPDAPLPAPAVVVSVDDGQHFPDRRSAAAFAATLASAKPERIFFAAATPGEGLARGRSEAYPTEESARWWAMAFARVGYELDLPATVQLRNDFFRDIAPFVNVWHIPKNVLVLERNPGHGVVGAETLREAAGFLGYGAQPDGLYGGPPDPLQGAAAASAARVRGEEYAWRLARDDAVLHMNATDVLWFIVGDETDPDVRDLLVDDARSYQFMVEQVIAAVQGAAARQERDPGDFVTAPKYEVPVPDDYDHDALEPGDDGYVEPASDAASVAQPDISIRDAGIDAAEAAQSSTQPAQDASATAPSRLHPADMLTFTSTDLDERLAPDVEEDIAAVQRRRAEVEAAEKATGPAVELGDEDAAVHLHDQAERLEATSFPSCPLGPNPDAGKPLAERDFGFLVKLYSAGPDCYDRLHASLLLSLDKFTAEQPMDRLVVDRFLAAFLYIMARPDFNVRRVDAAQLYLQHVRLLANMVRWSDYKSTDAQLRQLSSNEHGLVQMLTMYSPFNSVRVTAQQMWPGHQLLADLWLNRVTMLMYDGAMANSRFYRNFRVLLATMVQVHSAATQDYRTEPMLPFLAPVQPWWQSFELYFGISYVAPELEAAVKSHINAHYQTLLPREGVQAPHTVAPRRTYNGKRVCFVSSQWKVGHSVYRNFRPFVRAMESSEFETTLVILESDQILQDAIDTTGFDNIHVLDRNTTDDSVVELASWIKAEAFDLIMFPQIGMHSVDLYLANQRLAPVQVTSYGHSTSTHGALIDYYIGSAEVEAADAASRYSERLVLLPGLGILFEMPHSVPQPTAHPADNTSGLADGELPPPVIINAAWTMVKLNHDHLAVLAAIVRETQRHGPVPITFRFFTAVSAGMKYGNLALQEDLQAELGVDHYPVVSVQVVPAMPYVPYMKLVEEGDIALDSFHWGGCNSVFDQLVARVPTVVLEGELWRNRISPAMFRRFRLEDLVARSEGEFVETAARLILDAPFRAAQRKAVSSVDFTAVTQSKEANVFPDVVRYLIERHPAPADGDALPMMQPQNSSEPIVWTEVASS